MKLSKGPVSYRKVDFEEGVEVCFDAAEESFHLFLIVHFLFV